METTNTLQKAIEARASKKLTKKINEIRRFLFEQEYGFLEPVNLKIEIEGEIYNTTMSRILEIEKLRNALFDAHIDGYTKEETSIFLTQIDTMQSQIDKLKKFKEKEE